jgi:hypothetical protein
LIVLTRSGIVAGHREAGDSVDFYARHGRALHAQAARDGMEALLALYRSWRSRRAFAGQGWEVEWPVEPQMGDPTRR